MAVFYKIAVDKFKFDQCIPPIAFVITEETTIAVLGASFNDSGGKEAFFRFIKDKIRKENIDAKRIVFMAEAWSATVKDREIFENMRPSEHPDRVDSVIVHILDKSGEELCSLFEIEKKGNNVNLKLIHTLDDMDGMQNNLFGDFFGKRHNKMTVSRGGTA